MINFFTFRFLSFSQKKKKLERKLKIDEEKRLLLSKNLYTEK